MKTIILRSTKKSFYTRHLHSFCFLTKTNLTNYTNTNVIKTFNFYIHILYVHNVRKIRNGSHFVQRNIIIILTGEGAHEFFQEFINFLGKKDWGVLGGIFAGGLIIVGALLWKFGGPGQPESPNQPEDKKTSSSAAAKAALVPPSQSLLSRIWLNFNRICLNSRYTFYADLADLDPKLSHKDYEYIMKNNPELFKEEYEFYININYIISNLNNIKNQKIAFIKAKITLSQQLLTFEDITTTDDLKKIIQQIAELEDDFNNLILKENKAHKNFLKLKNEFYSTFRFSKSFYQIVDEHINKFEQYNKNSLNFYLEKVKTLEDLEPKINNINAFVDLYEKVEKNLPKNIKYVNKSIFFSNTLYEEKAKTEMLFRELNSKRQPYKESIKRLKISEILTNDLEMKQINFDINSNTICKIEIYNKILHSYLRNYDQNHFAKLEKFLLKKESLPINLKNKVDDTYNGILQEFACDCEVFSVTTGIHYYKQNTNVLFLL